MICERFEYSKLYKEITKYGGTSLTCKFGEKDNLGRPIGKIYSKDRELLVEIKFKRRNQETQNKMGVLRKLKEIKNFLVQKVTESSSPEEFLNKAKEYI